MLHNHPDRVRFNVHSTRHFGLSASKPTIFFFISLCHPSDFLSSQCSALAFAVLYMIFNSGKFSERDVSFSTCFLFSVSINLNKMSSNCINKQFIIIINPIASESRRKMIMISMLLCVFIIMCAVCCTRMYLCLETSLILSPFIIIWLLLFSFTSFHVLELMR